MHHLPDDLVVPHRMSNPSDDLSAKPTKRTTAKRTRKSAGGETPPSAPVDAPAPVEVAPPLDPAKNRAKRRRGKKGKGGGEAAAKPPHVDQPDGIKVPPDPQHAGHQASGDPETAASAPPAPRPQQRPHRHDSKDLSKKAWKIFLAEVSEEGIALIGDQDARELSRRCFRIAELFLDEQARHA